jgi:hypothetical protein
MALAVVQGATDQHSQATSSVTVTGAVTVADIQPVRDTLKDPHLRFAAVSARMQGNTAALASSRWRS